MSFADKASTNRADLRELIERCLADDRRMYRDGVINLATYRRLLRLHRGILRDVETFERTPA